VSHGLISVAGNLGCAELANRAKALNRASKSGSSELAPLIDSLTLAARHAVAEMRLRYHNGAQENGFSTRFTQERSTPRNSFENPALFGQDP
jgi:hypothetical protein